MQSLLPRSRLMPPAPPPDNDAGDLATRLPKRKYRFRPTTRGHRLRSRAPETESVAGGRCMLGSAAQLGQRGSLVPDVPRARVCRRSRHRGPSLTGSTTKSQPALRDNLRKEKFSADSSPASRELSWGAPPPKLQKSVALSVAGVRLAPRPIGCRLVTYGRLRSGVLAWSSTCGALGLGGLGRAGSSGGAAASPSLWGCDPEAAGCRWEPAEPRMRAGCGATPARELFRDAAFPAADSSLFCDLSTPLAQFREDITWRRPQVRWAGFLASESVAPGGCPERRAPTFVAPSHARPERAGLRVAPRTRGETVAPTCESSNPEGCSERSKRRLTEPQTQPHLFASALKSVCVCSSRQRGPPVPPWSV
ncbi:hypothetical protein P7K49_013276 [Saguinus oedipus]|uniref:Uncharacterized protein n=1 Tax=Saguinus oedipus TaxID=9490 RepID=A0ABQ9VG07_SAGOE|nr:hypothetical protein P7K49_013276 [Saguinus oedipus]